VRREEGKENKLFPIGELPREIEFVVENKIIRNFD